MRLSLLVTVTALVCASVMAGVVLSEGGMSAGISSGLMAAGPAKELLGGAGATAMYNPSLTSPASVAFANITSSQESSWVILSAANGTDLVAAVSTKDVLVGDTTAETETFSFVEVIQAIEASKPKTLPALSALDVDDDAYHFSASPTPTTTISSENLPFALKDDTSKPLPATKTNLQHFAGFSAKVGLCLGSSPHRPQWRTLLCVGLSFVDSLPRAESGSNAVFDETCSQLSDTPKFFTELENGLIQ
ncbi:MAG: hypothetical protein SGARI_004114 [Bacillariaceae sp.]